MLLRLTVEGNTKPGAASCLGNQYFRDRANSFGIQSSGGKSLPSQDRIFWRTKLSYVWDLGCPLASAVSLSFGKLPCSMILMRCQSHSHTPPSTRKSSPPDSQESLEISAKLGAGASDPKSLIALLETFYRDLRHQDTQHPCLLLVSP